jgi:8-oxo-dGTP pyrophosphatase MutT (NUDIX family)
VLLVLTGLLLSLYDTDQTPLWPGRLASIAGGIGATIAFYVFMEEAIPVAAKGAEALRQVLPEHFDWPWFLFALALMTVPLADMVWQIGSKNRSSDPQ